MFKALFCFVCVLLSGVVFESESAAMTMSQEWRFRVYLDDKEIGFHDFELTHSDGRQLLRSRASFEYRLLFVKLYEYEHDNTEIWQNDCLTGINSRTEANGTPFSVVGEFKGDVLVLEGSEGVTELPGCNRTFAYWNPSFLEQKKLINSQNGELLDVEISEPELEEIVVRGKRQPAWRYQLTARDMKIQLWYSQDKKWLGLESEARGGRRLRYVLI
jgi:hypothetical protein